MDRDEEGVREVARRRGRSWTERFSGPVRYRRFTDREPNGKRYIFFQFDLNPANVTINDAIYAILHEMKRLDRASGGQNHSGLTFKNDRIRGRVWKLPDDPTGRTAADIIDAKLSDLAEQSADDQPRSR